ncbi:MAG: UDP-N-acetyl-D-mannosaminuronic acid dehydrogenase, partial [Pseudarthrobacter sp.]|nr:UDP-N-acetyl-D-mannosaminuronic acid dehydrogenase [Pseudarthrobacter sp.]
VLLVDHDEFLSIDAASLAGKLVIDTKGIWNDQAAATVPPLAVGAGLVG